MQLMFKAQTKSILDEIYFVTRQTHFKYVLENLFSLNWTTTRMLVYYILLFLK